MDIFSNPRGWRVRIAQAAIYFFGAMIFWLAFFSNGRVESFGEQIFVWVIGALCVPVILFMAAYPYFYVIRMRLLREGLEITTLTLLSQRTFLVDPARVQLGRERHDLFVWRSIVSNFWHGLWIEGRALPLIVDVTAASLNARELERAVRQAQSPRGT
ncbi:MAG: hypothetical protein NVV62_17585 [Terricaulis sp.]|nr:hypothetical protein [Terricaulis sp.]